MKLNAYKRDRRFIIGLKIQIICMQYATSFILQKLAGILCFIIRSHKGCVIRLDLFTRTYTR